MFIAPFWLAFGYFSGIALLKVTGPFTFREWQAMLRAPERPGDLER
jgi:hypothetical protein